MKKLELEAQAEDDGDRLDRVIARRGGIARGEARRVLDRGGVWLDGKRVKAASRAVRRGQAIRVVLEEAGRTQPVAAALGDARVLFEDAHLVAVDKPPFVPAQSTLASDRGSLLSLVEAHVRRSVGLVHRLDLETSGVTVFGKTKAATTALAAAFRGGLARKRYLAVAVGPLTDEGRIDLGLGPDPRRKGRFLASARGEIPAATRYRVIGRRGPLCGVELFPETGRTHQIRCHLQALATPILGDRLYGGPAEIEIEGLRLSAPRMLLHARALDLLHPASGETLHLEAPIPDDLREALLAAGVDPADPSRAT